MANTKYLKFGLRADRNLADLTDTNSAINHLLDNVSDTIDIFEAPTGFTASDIAPIRNLSATDIRETLPNVRNAIPLAFSWLEDKSSFFQINRGDGQFQSILIEPQVTLQDLINRHKIVLGDPPFFAGGDGPNSSVIPSERLNSSYSATTGENKKHGVTLVRKGERFRIELLDGVPDAKWDDLAVNDKGSAYVETDDDTLQATGTGIVGDIFVASFDGTQYFNISNVDADNNNIYFENHGIPNGIEFVYNQTSGNGAIGGLTDGDSYFVVNRTDNTFELSTSSGGSAQTLTVTEGVVGTNYELVVSGYGNALVRNVTMPAGNFKTVTDNVTPERLIANEVYTRQDSIVLPLISSEPNLWNATGEFEFTRELNPLFLDQMGGIQFEGYQDSAFRPEISTNGFTTVEEDLIEDGTDNNWNLVVGTNTNQIRPIGKVTYTVDTSQILNPLKLVFSNAEDGKRIAEGMTVIFRPDSRAARDALVATDINNDPIYIDYSSFGRIHTVSYDGALNAWTAYVSNASGNTPQYIDHTQSPKTNVDVENAVGTTDILFSYELIDTTVSYPNVPIKIPTGTGARRRMRYTVWWRKGAGIDETRPVVKNWGDTSTGQSMGFKFFYKTENNQDFNAKRYSFPYFKDNRASATQQKTDNELKVSGLTRIQYTPKVKSIDTIPFYNVGSNNIPQKTIQVDNQGLAKYGAENEDPPAEVGDFVVISTNSGNNPSNTYAFQIIETVPSRGEFLLDKTFNDIVGYSAGLDINIMYVKNEGLIGIYQYDNTGTSPSPIHRIRPLPTVITSPRGPQSSLVSEVKEGDLLYQVIYTYTGSNHSSHDRAFKVLTTDHNDNEDVNTTNITVEAPIYDNNATLNLNDGLVLVYSSRGLVDRSPVIECTNVFAKEVSAPASANQNTLTLKNVSGIVARDPANSTRGTYVHLDGTVPFKEQETHGPTEVGSINGNAITLVQATNGDASEVSPTDVLLAKDVTPGTTVVFIPPTAGPNTDGWGNTTGYTNKEYCVAPLNTAPPWAATEDGLATPLTFPELIAKEARFTKLSFNNISDTCITPYENGISGVVSVVSYNSGDKKALLSTTGEIPSNNAVIVVQGGNEDHLASGTYILTDRDISLKQFKLSLQNGNAISPTPTSGALENRQLVVNRVPSYMTVKYTAP